MAVNIIKFLTGTTRQLQPWMDSSTTQEYIAFNKTTGQLWWNHEGIKYWLKCAPDWNESDSTSPNYIKNKPHIADIDDLISALDIKDIADSTNLVTSFRQLIVPSQVTLAADGRRLLILTSKRMPSMLITSTRQHPLEADSVEVAVDNTITIDLSRYLAYQNTTTIPANSWYLYYG